MHWEGSHSSDTGVWSRLRLTQQHGESNSWTTSNTVDLDTFGKPPRDVVHRPQLITNTIHCKLQDILGFDESGPPSILAGVKQRWHKGPLMLQRILSMSSNPLKVTPYRTGCALGADRL